jgi:hypothetical protein
MPSRKEILLAEKKALEDLMAPIQEKLQGVLRDIAKLDEAERIDKARGKTLSFQRNLDIFRRVITGEIYAEVGARYDIGPERVRQIVWKLQRIMNGYLARSNMARIEMNDIALARQQSERWLFTLKHYEASCHPDSNK